ncbi:electron transport complex subunit RsxB [Magnetospira sp. QH-2]|uniref:electron transport complex subunit RsxB n=1 Tax=Magnetospira sp. (strain QH-2) TaxID=1288970 RepID=UPI0003E817DA|nr:electron transport complex subunit RsxB [Magnetospira sp. QH-2]CCQ72921.1 Electron transport complex protein rnfB, iron sulfur protein [Magnetospira sp. QH-2]
MIEAIASLTVLGIVLGTLLGLAARYLKTEGNPLAEEIEEMMPGTQCGQCGFPGCAPAAEALAVGEAEVTLCPPGGRALASDLADKLGVDINLSDMAEKELTIAYVNEDECIGCARCFQVCHVDALVGAPKQMYTVISAICDGCDKCAEVCPTDCIDMNPVAPTVNTWYWPKPKPDLTDMAA